MRKARMLAAAVLVMGLLGGCGKFSPEETAISIGKDGAITAAVIDTLEESYYSSEELTKDVESSVIEYNNTAGENTVEIEKFEIKDGNVELFMKYASYKDYQEFNNIDFYVGDITNGYNEAGFRFETTFKEVENGEVTREGIEKEEIYAGKNYPMMVFHEDMEVTVPGKILYISSNLILTGKTSAKMTSDEQTEESETESQKATEEGETNDGVMEIAPVVETKAQADSGENEGKGLAYIIYEE